MKRIARILALIAGLFPAMVAAQAPNLPANTLYGRLGVPSTGGPAQAIPIATLGANLGFPTGPQSCSSHNWFNSLSKNGTLGCTQPSIADILGFGAGVQTALSVPANSAGGVATSPVGNANLAQGVAGAVKCNPTNATAAFQDCPNGPTAFATMQPANGQGSGAWLVSDPYGNAISTTGTTCQGFDKLLAAANTNGWSWRVLGDGTISCTAPIALPTCFLKQEFINGGVKIVFTAQGSSNLVTMDSHENCHTNFKGSFTQAAGDTGFVLSMVPTNPDAASNVGIVASEIEISSIGPATTGNGVKLDPTTGGILGNQITIHDVNGGLTGIQVANPGTAFIAFAQNKIFLTYNHGATLREVQIGTSSSNQGNMRDNTWFPGRVDPNGGTAGWDSWASNDTYIGLSIDSDTAAATTGLVFESGANGNTVVGGLVQGTTVLSDSGTGNNYHNVKGISSSYAGTATNDHASLGNIGEYRFANCTVTSSAVTITIASPAVISWASHPFLNNPPPLSGEIDACPLKFTTTGALPTGITAGTTYWVSPSSIVAGTSFKIATTLANALAGTFVNTSGTQSGTQTGNTSVSDFVANPSTNNVTALSLPAGDWDCRGNMVDNPAGTTVVTNDTVAFGTTSVTLPSAPAGGSYSGQSGSLTGTPREILVGTEQFSLSAATTVYELLNSAFTTSTQGVLSAFMGCRRAR